MTNAIFDGDAHELALRRLNLVFNTSHGESKYPGRVEITPELCQSYFAVMGEPSDVAEALFMMVVPDFGEKPTRAALEKSQPVFRQLAALLEFSAWLTIEGTPFVWKYPESGLHPKYQLNLADAAIAFSDPVAMKRALARYLHK